MKRGADINRKTLKGETSLRFAVENFDGSMLEFLLKNGAIVDDVEETHKETALGYASRTGEDNLIRILLDYGADLNKTNELNETPFTVADDTFILVKELAKLKFESKFICNRNLEYLQQKENVREVFEDCIKELQKMRDTKFYNNFSLYEILKLRKNRIKLILLTKNEDFVSAFKLTCNISLSFEYYGDDLKDDFENALKKRDILECEKKKIYESGLGKKFSVPSEVIEIIAEFATKHLLYSD